MARGQPARSYWVMATSVQVYLQPVLERNEYEGPLNTLEMTCESRGCYRVSDLKSVNLKRALKYCSRVFIT